MNKFLIVIPVNGLFNRIRTMVSAAIIAKKYNYKVHIIWDGEIMCNCSYDDIFDDNNDLWELIEPEKSYNQSLGNLLKNIPPYLNKISKSTISLRGLDKGEQFFMKDFISSSRNIKIIQAGGNFYDDENMSKYEYVVEKSKIYNSIKWNKTVLSSIPKDIFSSLNFILGVHLRYTDSIDDAPNDDTLYKSIDEIMKDKNNNDKNLLLISDCQSEKDKAYNNLKKKYKNIYTTQIDSYDRGSTEGMQGGLRDWIILSKTSQILFYSYSSYGYEACVPNMLFKSKEIPYPYALEDFPLSK